MHTLSNGVHTLPTDDEEGEKPLRKSVVLVVPDECRIEDGVEDSFSDEDDDVESIPSPTMAERDKRGAYHRPKAPRPIAVGSDTEDSLKSPGSLLSVQLVTPPPTPVDYVVPEKEKKEEQGKRELSPPISEILRNEVLPIIEKIEQLERMEHAIRSRTPVKLRKPPPQAPPPSPEEVTRAAVIRASCVRYSPFPTRARNLSPVRHLTTFAPPPPPIDPTPEPPAPVTISPKKHAHLFSRVPSYTSTSSRKRSATAVPVTAPSGRKRGGSLKKDSTPVSAKSTRSQPVYRSRSSRSAGWDGEHNQIERCKTHTGHTARKGRSACSAGHTPQRFAREEHVVLHSSRRSGGFHHRNTTPSSFSRQSTGERIICSGTVPESMKTAYHRSHTDIRRR